LNTTKLYTEKNYPAKLILFGEYTVLFGGDVLAIPLEKYSCEWQEGSSFEHEALGNHIAKVVDNYPFLHFDIYHWTEFIGNHYLYSTIPLGYGLGSSGAVTAAIFEHFFSIKDFQNDLFLLKTFLGELESYFHGKSSGVDPLVSLLKTPILIKENHVEMVVLNEEYNQEFDLYDSGIARNNKGIIAKVVSQYQEDVAYRNKLDQLCELNNAVIAKYIMGDFLESRAIVQEISAIQLELFDEDLIPSAIRKIWESSMQNKEGFFKLCGGGGGGYFFRFGN
jgi:mevalonate kinase